MRDAFMIHKIINSNKQKARINPQNINSRTTTTRTIFKAHRLQTCTIQSDSVYIRVHLC